MNKSFTLIEILVVIVVIGVLSAFILVGMSSITSSANIAKGQAFANSVKNALLIDLVSEWKLDGNTTDSWGTYNGIIAGTTTETRNCVSGSCLKFNGTNTDYIRFGDVLDYVFVGTNKKFTISVWCNQTATDANTRALVIKYADSTTSENQREVLSYINSGAAIFGYWGALDGASYRLFQTSTTPISPSKWHHLLFIYDGSLAYDSRAKVYINTINQTLSITATAGSPASIPDGTAQFGIGASIKPDGTATSYNFNGYIDDVKLYNNITTMSQAKQMYFSGINKLFKNNAIVSEEFNQRIVELKNNLVNNE